MISIFSLFESLTILRLYKILLFPFRPVGPIAFSVVVDIHGLLRFRFQPLGRCIFQHILFAGHQGSVLPERGGPLSLGSSEASLSFGSFITRVWRQRFAGGNLAAAEKTESGRSQDDSCLGRPGIVWFKYFKDSTSLICLLVDREEMPPGRWVSVYCFGPQ